MNLHALRIFTEVAKTGSVTRSSENLMISQPAVSAQIRNLEQEVGMKLIQGKGRTIQLTEAGTVLSVYANRLFSLEREIENEMKAMLAGVKGRVIICTTEFPGRTVLPDLIVEYKRIFPFVELQVYRSSSLEAVQRLLNHSVHLAFVCGELEHLEGIQSHKIFDDELIFIVHPEHPFANKQIHLEQLCLEPFILRESSSYTMKKVESICREMAIDGPSPGILIEGIFESVEAVKSGYGVALVPARAVEKSIRNQEVSKINIPNLHINHPVWLCVRKDEEPLLPAANFISIVANRYKMSVQS